MLFLETKQFKKDKKKLSLPLQEKILERLNLLIQEPSHPLLSSHRLNPPWKGCESINISGDIRLIYKKEGFVYRLVRVGFHSELYK